jgi:hypothetical protein
VFAPERGVLLPAACCVPAAVLQCFEGHHRAVALFGLVMLLLVGVLFPVAAAVLLWVNRQRLDEADFAWKVSYC